MRFATILVGGRPSVAVVRDGDVLPLTIPGPGFGSLRAIAGRGVEGLGRVREWVAAQPERSYRRLDDLDLAPAVPDPGAIYAIGLNYDAPDGPGAPAPQRPLVYGKLPTSVAGHGSVLRWERSLTSNVDAEVELGVVIGPEALAVAPEDAMRHVFGYTCIDDVSSRDPWLDGDQWLLGKSMAGFCPVGPWVVTRDEFDPADVRLGCTINGVPTQDDRTVRMRFSITDVVSFISHHAVLRPGDLIATGTPARLRGPLGPERHLEVGDLVTVWIEGIGELTTHIG